MDRASSNPKVTSGDLDSSSGSDASGNDSGEEPVEEAAADANNGATDVPNDEPNDESEAVASTPVPASVTTKNPPKKKGKQASSRAPSPSSNSVIDQDTVSMFGVAKSSSEARLKLMADQHKETMDIERRKVTLEEQRAAAMDWSAKREQLAYKSELYDKYAKLQADGLDDDTIVSMFPEVQFVIDAKKAKKPRPNSD